MRYRASVALAFLAAASVAFAATQSAPPASTPPAAPAKPEAPAKSDTPSKPAAPTAPPATPPKDGAKETPGAAAPAKQTPRQRAKAIKEITGTIETESGTITFKLEPNKCPLLCANFCNLVRQGFFDGRQWRDFSRVIRQVGTDTVWYTLPREFDPSLFFDRGGQIAMSKDTDDTVSAKSHGTRFFVTVKNQERWNLDYPIFGHITSGMDLLLDMKHGPPELTERHETIKKITVEGDVDNLLATFAPEVAEWNKALETAKARGLH